MCFSSWLGNSQIPLVSNSQNQSLWLPQTLASCLFRSEIRDNTNVRETMSWRWFLFPKNKIQQKSMILRNLVPFIWNVVDLDYCSKPTKWTKSTSNCLRSMYSGFSTWWRHISKPRHRLWTLKSLYDPEQHCAITSYLECKLLPSKTIFDL